MTIVSRFSCGCRSNGTNPTWSRNSGASKYARTASAISVAINRMSTVLPLAPTRQEVATIDLSKNREAFAQPLHDLVDRKSGEHDPEDARQHVDAGDAEAVHDWAGNEKAQCRQRENT